MALAPFRLMAFDTPILRAYLAVLKELGLRCPQATIILFKNLPGSKKRLSTSYLPAPLRNIFLSKTLDACMNYYPRFLRKKYPIIYQEIQRKLEEKYSFSPLFLKSFERPLNYKDYADTIDYISVTSYQDERFFKYIEEINDTTLFLYTGGGILPSAAFKNDKVRYLHIHPGYLPFVRGADCYLWSTLLSNNIGASCFIMSPGLDDGDILLAQKFSPFSISSPANLTLDLKTQYRFLYSFLDPCLRGQVLKSTLEKYKDLSRVEGIPQKTSEGETFYFMNPFLQRCALQKIFLN